MIRIRIATSTEVDMCTCTINHDSCLLFQLMSNDRPRRIIETWRNVLEEWCACAGNEWDMPLYTSTYNKEINGLINSCQYANGRINSVLKLNNSKHARKKWDARARFQHTFTSEAWCVHPQITDYHTVHLPHLPLQRWHPQGMGVCGCGLLGCHHVCQRAGGAARFGVWIIGPGQHGLHHNFRSITHVTKMGGTLVALPSTVWHFLTCF
jgi:hypothetical protein